MYRSSKNVCIRNLVEIRTSLAENAKNTFQNICPIGYKIRKLYSSYLVAIDGLHLTSWGHVGGTTQSNILLVPL